MKLQIVSDLHIEWLEDRFGLQPTLPYAAGADVLVLAGDIHQEARALDAFADWPVPVVMVHGNHEHYNEHMERTIEKLRRLSSTSSVHYLECEEWIYQGTRFLGCCLWTDYALDGDSRAGMAHANAALNDHRMIRTDVGRFAPEDALEMHKQSRAWLESRLNEPFDGKTVVVTHHAPHSGSVAKIYEDDPLNPAFASDLTPLMGKSTLWIHGHTHSSFDYMVSGTRIVANPRGYPLNRNMDRPLKDFSWENAAFQPELVIEI